jgi:hypothetical protein
MMIEINIGIVGDGPTDHKVFEKIVKCVLLGRNSNHVQLNIIPLVRQNIHDHVQRYKTDAGRNKEYYLPSKTALTLRDNVLGTLISAFNEFQGTVELSHRDILLITTDTEHTLTSQNMYFDTWAFSVSQILMGAIEKFYNFQAGQHYPRQGLPIVMSLATFPSTEVIVAAARGLLDKNYGKKAKEWKHLLYKNENPRDEEVQEQALNFITSESIDLIFRDLPESRLFIQTLSLGLKRCLLDEQSDCENYGAPANS